MHDDWGSFGRCRAVGNGPGYPSPNRLGCRKSVAEAKERVRQGMAAAITLDGMRSGIPGRHDFHANGEPAACGLPGRLRPACPRSRPGQVPPNESASNLISSTTTTELRRYRTREQVRRFLCSPPMVFLPRCVITLRQCLMRPGSLPTARTERRCCKLRRCRAARLPVSAGQAAQGAQRCRQDDDPRHLVHRPGRLPEVALCSDLGRRAR